MINEKGIFSKEIKGLLKNNLNDIEQNSCSTSECILFIVWVLLQEDEYYEAYNLINQVSYDTLEPISLVYNDLYNEIKRNLFINNQFELSLDEYKFNHDTEEYYYFYLKDLYYKSTQERYSSKIENALSTTYYALFTLSTKIPNKEYDIIISKLLFRLGVLYMEQYEFKIAINCFQKCSELAYNKSTTLKQWYLSELQLAYNNAILNNYSNAIYHLENVDKIEEINPFLTGYTLYIKALVYFRLNEYSEALNLISGVELSSFECSDIDNRIYDFKAFINKTFGNYNHALENSNLALNYLPCDSIRQMSIEQYSFLRTKGSIYFEMEIDSRQSLELALENFVAQKKKVDFVNQEDISHYGDMLASASENVLKTLFHLNQIDPQKQHLNQAFQTLSEAKNRSIKIADRKHRSQYFLNLSHRDQKKLTALNHIIESCLDSCDHFNTIKPFDSEFYKDLYFAYKEKDELLAQYPQEQISLEADSTEMDLKGLQIILGEHHAQYIDYFFGQEYGIVLSLTSDTCVLDTFDMTLTETTARKVYNDLIREDTLDIDANHTLASIILNPYIDTSLNQLIVCPDNILNGIPFSALSINQD
ncbi:MAG: hypothetical protein HKN09_03580, partial [Saprospiraceae bacterium]|nr:hypothetical protein [Saprospiraceae bacterium]